MFRDAAAVDQRATNRRIAQLQERYAAEAETFFDGSVDSVDRRIAACDQILSRARSAAVRLGYQEGYTEIAASLENDRQALTELREALLNGASDREVTDNPSGRRTASTVRLARPGTQEDYLDFAHSQGADPSDPQTIGLYSMTTGIPFEQLAGFLTLASRRTATASPGTFDHYMDYANQNGLQPGDSMTADRYSRENNVPLTRTNDFVTQFGQGRQKGQPKRPAPGPRTTTSPTPLTAALRRSLDLDTRAFLAENTDCVDYLPELQYRARRYAQNQTSSLSPELSHRYVEAFVARVEAMGKRVPRRVAKTEPTTVNDFPAELLYD